MSETKHTPFVPDSSTMQEGTARALLLGLVMCVILGAANAYLGLRAGMTIAATYPAAVIGMAVLRLRKGTLLEENFARTVGSMANRSPPGPSSPSRPSSSSGCGNSTRNTWSRNTSPRPP